MVRNLKLKIRPLALLRPRKKLNAFIILGIVLASLGLSITSLSIIHADKNLQKKILGESKGKSKTIQKTEVAGIQINSPSANASSTPTKAPTETPVPTLKPKPSFTPSPTITPTPIPKQYTAEKIGDTTYKINNTSTDDNMASAQEIYNALNAYRSANGRSSLSWDNNLALLAQERVNTFTAKNDLDSHAGFRNFMDNDGFSKAGFNGLGENSAKLAGNMSSERIIKEIFGADADHDGNQLDSTWTHVAVAVNGVFINVNFGKGKR